jgi:hypothetical protein
MQRQKGKKVEAWNWQAMEAKYGPESEVSSQYEILSHYHSSGEDAKSVGKASVRSRSRPTKKVEIITPGKGIKKAKTTK